MRVNFKLWFRKLGAWFGQKFKFIQDKLLMKVKQKEIQINLGEDMYLEAVSIQGQGSRAYQQDTFGFSAVSNKTIKVEQGYMAVLADGMGGMAHGDKISKFIVQEVLKQEIHMAQNIDMQLREIVHTISGAVYKKFEGLGGSTVIITYIDKKQLHWVSVGDSHLYIKRQGKLYLMNEEHNYLTHLYKGVLKGYLTKEEAESHKSRYGLTQFVGNDKITDIEGSYEGFRLQNQDIILICTDGISDTLSDVQINDLLMENIHESAKAIENQIIAMQNEYQDNFTALIMKWSGENGV